MQTRIKHPFYSAAIAATAAMLFGSSAAIAADASSCSSAIAAADAKLAEAESNGAVEAVVTAEASTLIAAAKVQRTFKEYAKCVDKASRAEAMLSN